MEYYLVGESNADVYYKVNLFLPCVGLWYLRVWFLYYRDHVVLGYSSYSFSDGAVTSESVERSV